VSISIVPAYLSGYRALPKRAPYAGSQDRLASRPRRGLSRAFRKIYNASVRGAQITVRCDCGGVGYVPYGERWECPTCHRRWNTGQIPAEEYWGIMRDMRRTRINVLATALGLILPILILAAVAGIRILALLPVVMGFWFLFYMPRWRRRVRLQARNLQRWQLHPE
jgi:hypothetical protein